MRRLLHDLSGVLEETVGLDEAAGFIAVVGQRMGEWMDRQYRHRLGLKTLSTHDVARVLVDLKARIQGGFSIESVDDERIILANTRCPFGDYVFGRPSLCMMTSNVFGVIAAENLGYARIDLERTIARGDSGCRVVIHLQPDSTSRVDTSGLLSREYFATR
ncbi:MAG: methanogen output domain 1-containing protein [Thioalkalivibrionaceae bacterium]